MKLILFGTGMIGTRILAEALQRGHSVTVVSRDPRKITPPAGKVNIVKGDVLNAANVALLVKGSDAVISAIGGTPDAIKEAPLSLLVGLKMAGVKRLIVVGGAGSLEVAPGKLAMDTPTFPEDWKGIARAHAKALEVLKKSTTIDWTCISPAALISPGERTGKFRLGTEQLITNKNGDSRISAEDFAVALLNEVEKPQHIHQRFTLAY